MNTDLLGTTERVKNASHNTKHFLENADYNVTCLLEQSSRFTAVIFPSVHQVIFATVLQYRPTTWSRYECSTRWHLLGWLWQKMPPLCWVSAVDSPVQGSFPVWVPLPSEKHYNNTWKNTSMSFHSSNKKRKEQKRNVLFWRVWWTLTQAFLKWQVNRGDNRAMNKIGVLFSLS